MSNSDPTPLLGLGTFLGVLSHWLFMSWLVSWAVAMPGGSLLSGVLVGTISLIVGVGGLIFAFRASFPDYAKQVALRSGASAICLGVAVVIGQAQAPWAWGAMLITCFLYGLCQASLYPCRLLIAGQIRQDHPQSPAFNMVKFTAVLGLAGGYALHAVLGQLHASATLLLGAVCLTISAVLFRRLNARLPSGDRASGLMNLDAPAELKAWSRCDRSAAVLLGRAVWTSGLAFGGLQVVGVVILSNATGGQGAWLTFVRDSGLLVVSLGLMIGSLTGAGAAWRSSQAWVLHVGVWALLATLGVVSGAPLVAAVLLACGIVLGRLSALVPARLAERAQASEQHGVLSLFAIAMTGAPAIGALLGGALAEQFGPAGAIVAMALVGAAGNAAIGLGGREVAAAERAS